MLSFTLLQDVQNYINLRRISIESVPEAPMPQFGAPESCAAPQSCPAPEPCSEPKARRASLFNFKAVPLAKADPESIAYDGSAAFVLDDIKTRLAEKDESFSDHLLRRIDAAGMTDAECYNKAQITRQLFNRIKNTKDYRPSKGTVVALGFALELEPEEFGAFLKKAGYSLSNSSDFDLIVDYCIVHNIYAISDVNELLFSFDQPLLGSK